MASRPVKLKLLPRSTLKAKVVTRLANGVVGEDGITVIREGGNYTISLENEALQSVAAHSYIGNNTGGALAPQVVSNTELTADLDIHGQTLNDTVDSGADEIIYYDASEGAIRRTRLANVAGDFGTMAEQDADDVSISGGTITGMPAPTLASDVATKAYVDTFSSGISIGAAMRLATAAVLPSSPSYANGAAGVGATLIATIDGALVVDGVTVVNGDRVLVKDQAAPAQNGVYTATDVGTVSDPYTLTRVTDFDTAGEMLAGTTFLVEAGTQAGQVWALQATVATVGTSAVNFAQYSSSVGALLAANNLSDVLSPATARENLGIGVSPVVTPDMADGTLQGAIDAAELIGGSVDGLHETYTLTTALLMAADVTVRNATILQGAAANLARVVDFHTNLAHRAALIDCEVDGNRANNTFSQVNNLIYTGSANFTRIEGCYIHDAPGNGIVHYLGANPIIHGNRIDFIANLCIVASAGASPVAINGRITENNITRSAQHTICVWSSDEFVVDNNYIDAALTTSMLFDFNGTLATWKSGTACTDLYPGMFLIANSGAEYFITAKPTAATFTITPSAPVLANTATIGGAGDVISVENSSFVRVRKNRILAGITGGVIVSDIIDPGGAMNDIELIDNTINRCGESGMGVAATNIDRVRIKGNSVLDVGLADAATPATYKDGISIQGTPTSIDIDQNEIADRNGLLQYGMAVPTAPGCIRVGTNSVRGALQAGIRNGATVVLGAGWGSTAAVSALVSQGSEISFTVTANGSSIAAFPSITITTNATKLHATPMWTAKQVGGTAAQQNLGLFAEDLLNTIWTWGGTPVAGETHKFVFK